MHLRAYAGTTLYSLFAVALALLATVGLAVLLSTQAFAQSNSAPDFGATTATRSVNENTASYTNIGTPITATDGDDDLIIYTIKNSRTSPFYIDWFTGQLQVGSPLDYEEDTSHDITVVATDPEGATDEITVTVNVGNVDEYGEVTMMWKPGSGSNVDFSAEVIDPDGITGTTTWQWAGSSTQNGSYTDITSATSATFTHDGTHNYLKVTASYTDAAYGQKTLSKTQQIELPSSIDSSYTFHFEANTANGYGCDNNEADICRSVPKNKTPGESIYYPNIKVYRKTDALDRQPSSLFPLSYSLTGTDAGSFDIDPARGTLLTKGPLAYDDKSHYFITITATDPSGRNGSLTIRATPISSSLNPTVMGPDYIDYPENGTWPIAFYDGQIRGREFNQDVGWIISVEPGGGDGDYFDINDDGMLYFTQPPDHENPADENGDSMYSFHIHAYDTNPRNGNRSGQTFFNVTVRVVDAQEALEIDGPTTIEYAENGTDPVHTYTLTGATTGTVTWSIAEGDSSLFTMNNGVLAFRTSPDYENPFDSSDSPVDQNDYLLNIFVTDGSTSGKSEPVRIMVTNVNEPPAFPATETGRRTISESAVANENIGARFQAEDPDGPDVGLGYSLGGTDALSFSIGEYTGQLKTAALLDFESKSTYSLTVSVTDYADAEGNSDSSADDTVNVTVTVEGANEAPTIIGESTIDYPETSTLPVHDYNATDPENDTVTWSLKEVDDYDDLSIDTTTGVLTFDSPPDYEDPNNTDHQYEVTVVATDSESNSSELGVTITIFPINDPPVLTYDGNTGDQAIDYKENGTGPVGTIVATDQDSTTITWAKSSDSTDVKNEDAALFAISNAGVLSFVNSPDYEDPKDQTPHNSYRVRVEAGDGTNTSAMYVTVNVQDVDEAPVITGEASPAVTEGSTDTIATYTKTDPEGATTTWEDPAGDDGAFFEISSSGDLSFKVAPDHEADADQDGDNIYQVTLKATDQTSNTGEKAITVRLQDDNEPVNLDGIDTSQTFTKTYEENSTEIVKDFDAEDPEGKTLVWDVTGDDDNRLDITNAGVLTFNTSPNFEAPNDDNTDGVYEVTVTVKPEGEEDESLIELDVEITIGDVNETPDITGPTTVTVEEGNTATGAVYAHNDPEGDSGVTWDTPTGADGSLFEISAAGSLSFKTAPDFENPTDTGGVENEYEVTLTVRDSEFDDSIDVKVTVSNDDESPNVTGPTTVDHPENTVATDADYEDNDPENGTVAWEALGDDGDKFNITATGQLVFKSAPDFEARGSKAGDNNYKVTVKATVGDSSHQLDVVVKVYDVNEAPVIGQTDTNYPHEENDASSVATFTATDEDAGDTVTWSKSGDDDGYFDLHKDTGVLSFKSPPDYEHEVDGVQKYVYNLTVQASDGEITVPLAITVTVSDVDETPEITGETDDIDDNHTFEYAEDRTDEVHTFTAPDPEGATTIWTLDGADKDEFTIAGGVLRFDDHPNFESPTDSGSNNLYNIVIKAADRTNDDPNIGEFRVNVRVTDVNEDPQFDAETATIEVAENTATNRDIPNGKFTATDEDRNARLTYELGGTDASSFGLNTSNGQLRTRDALDYETKHEYEVTILVRDGVDDENNLNNTADDTIDITINVTNLNENGEVTLSAQQPQEDVEITASLTDGDGSVSSVTWQWATASSKNGFPNTVTCPGTGASAYTPVTADVNKYLRATACYTDGEGSGKKAYGVSANRVQAAPPDPMPPVFSQDSTTRSVAENATPETNVGRPVTASDPERKALTYTLEGTNASSFTIVQSSGQIKTKENVDLDFETKPTYTVTVRATDPGDLSDTIVVTINLVDVNEPPGRVTINTVMADPNNQQSGLMVKWSPPENSGPDITGYNLKYSQQGSNGWEEDETSTTQKELSDLLPDTEYEVMVNAENSEGGGTWSESVKGRTEAKPEANWIPLTAEFASSSYSVTEGRSRTITVNLSPAADRRQSIPIEVDAGATSASSSDYSLNGLTSGELPFVPGKTSVTFTLRANDDSDKRNETVKLQFGTLPNKIIAGTRTSVTVRINDDDNEPPPTPAPRPDPNPDPAPVPSLPLPPSTGGGGFGGGGSGGSGGGSTGGGGTSGDPNRPPYFNEGVSTQRDVREHTNRGIYIGEPVTATDPDGDVLTYALGGTDMASFALDTATGQLITSATLDLESKASYEVVMTVSDGRGAVDAIEITIELTDVLEVPIYNPQTQASGRVGPGGETTVRTPDGSAAVHFPAQSRSGYYWVRVDSAQSRCPFVSGDEDLETMLALDFYDNWGTPESGVVLLNGAIVEFRLAAADFGGQAVVERAHELGAFHVYARDPATMGWAQARFDLEVDSDGWIVIQVPDLTTLDCFVLTAIGALFTSGQPAPTPTPTPTPMPQSGATPAPTPQTTLEPTATVEPQGIKIPLLVPQSVVEAVEESLDRESSDPGDRTTPTPEPLLQEAQLVPETVDEDGLSVWPILFIALVAALLALSLWLFLRAKRQRRF